MMPLRGSIPLEVSLIAVVVATTLLSQQASASVILEAPVGAGNYFGLYNTSGLAATFTLTGSYSVSSIDVFVRPPASTTFTNFSYSL